MRIIYVIVYILFMGMSMRKAYGMVFRQRSVELKRVESYMLTEGLGEYRFKLSFYRRTNGGYSWLTDGWRIRTFRSRHNIGGSSMAAAYVRKAMEMYLNKRGIHLGKGISYSVIPCDVRFFSVTPVNVGGFCKEFDQLYRAFESVPREIPRCD